MSVFRLLWDGLRRLYWDSRDLQFDVTSYPRKHWEISPTVTHSRIDRTKLYLNWISLGSTQTSCSMSAKRLKFRSFSDSYILLTFALLAKTCSLSLTTSILKLTVVLIIFRAGAADVICTPPRVLYYTAFNKQTIVFLHVILTEKSM